MFKGGGEGRGRTEGVRRGKPINERKGRLDKGDGEGTMIREQ